MILTEKLQKYQPYHQAKLIRSNTLQIKKYYLLIKKKQKQTEQAKLFYSPLGKAFKKQTGKDVITIKSLKPSFDKTNELKQIENAFTQYIVNKMIGNKFKKY